jgi:hypothetical protein
MLDNSYTKHWNGYSEIIFSTTVAKITLLVTAPTNIIEKSIYKCFFLFIRYRQNLPFYLKLSVYE